MAVPGKLNPMGEIVHELRGGFAVPCADEPGGDQHPIGVEFHKVDRDLTDFVVRRTTANPP